MYSNGHSIGWVFVFYLFTLIIDACKRSQNEIHTARELMIIKYANHTQYESVCAT